LRRMSIMCSGEGMESDIVKQRLDWLLAGIAG
jgi:hypothetical protein